MREAPMKDVRAKRGFGGPQAARTDDRRAALAAFELWQRQWPTSCHRREWPTLEQIRASMGHAGETSVKGSANDRGRRRA
jgi:hypothetical protein